MQKPLTPKTVAKTPGRGPRTKGALPRYVALGNAKKVASRMDVFRGRVFVDLDENRELIGVEVIG